jgi:hypothetical protein
MHVAEVIVLLSAILIAFRQCINIYTLQSVKNAAIPDSLQPRTTLVD